MATFCTRGLLSSKAVAKASIPTSCLPASQWSAVMRTEDSGSAIRFCRRRDTPSDSTTDTARNSSSRASSFKAALDASASMSLSSSPTGSEADRGASARSEISDATVPPRGPNTACMTAVATRLLEGSAAS